MNKLNFFIYNLFSEKMRKKLGKSKILAPFRDLFFRRKGYYKDEQVIISRKYLNQEIKFKFYASLQVANKAKRKGIENTILNNSLNLLKSVDNDSVVFDVGANFGYLSLVWASTVCRNGKVYSFEPHPKLIRSLKSSVFSNSYENRIILENVALGERLDEKNIYLASASSNFLNDYKTVQFSNKVQVKIINLDYYMKINGIVKCDLIKIDVDGIEYDILKGSLSLIKELRPIFIVETNNDHRILTFFKKQNYQIFNMKLNLIKEHEMPVNIFCIPNK